ncbi:MAG: hypothetical protein R2755_02715 [Acidimicrobiales bacterium]
MPTSSASFRQRFDEAVDAWVDVAAAAGRFSSAIASLTPDLTVGSEVELEHLRAAVQEVGEANVAHHVAMWSLLQRIAIHDEALTDALIEILRRNIGEPPEQPG